MIANSKLPIVEGADHVVNLWIGEEFNGYFSN